MAGNSKEDRDMQNNRGSGKRNMGGVIVSIAVAIFGIIFTVGAVSAISRSPFNNGFGPKQIFIAFGVLFVLVAVINAVKFYKGEINEDGTPRSSAADRSDKEELVDRIVSEVRKTQQPQRRTEKWTCAYCGTMVDENASICPACGAGRKKSEHKA